MDEPAADATPANTETALYGARWAIILAATLLIALALLTAKHWLAKRGVPAEEIVQIPVPAITPKPSPSPELLAPDPGDTP